MLCLCCLWEHFLFRISQHKRLISLSFILHLSSLIQQPLFCHSFFHLPVKWVMFFVFTQISYVIPLLRIKKRFNYDCRCELELCVFLVSFFFSVLFYLSISYVFLIQKITRGLIIRKFLHALIIISLPFCMEFFFFFLSDCFLVLAVGFVKL